MLELRAPRPSLPALGALAAALLLPIAAPAAPAVPTVASDVCNYASNKPALLQTRLEAFFRTVGFIGLPEEQCPKFVKSLVKHCVSVVASATKCSVDLNSMVGKMSDLQCDAEESSEDRSSCKSTVKQDLKNENATASQTVDLQGQRSCNVEFAARMQYLCINGWLPPPT